MKSTTNYWYMSPRTPHLLRQTKRLHSWARLVLLLHWLRICLLSWWWLNDGKQGLYFWYLRRWRCWWYYNTGSPSFWQVDRDPLHNQGILSQNRPIYKSTSTMAACKRSHYHTWTHINTVVRQVPRMVSINLPHTTKIVHDSIYMSHIT